MSDHGKVSPFHRAPGPVGRIDDAPTRLMSRRLLPLLVSVYTFFRKLSMLIHLFVCDHPGPGKKGAEALTSAPFLSCALSFV